MGDNRVGSSSMGSSRQVNTWLAFCISAIGFVGLKEVRSICLEEVRGGLRHEKDDSPKNTTRT